MKEPSWLRIARSHVGLVEIPGKEHAPVISGWLLQLKAWWRDDETPWCGTFVAACMRDAWKPLPKHWYRAKDWLNWGATLTAPAVGCVVVYERKGGGHVGFIVGQDQTGNLMTLGGNQGNRVSILPFAPERAVGFRWPANSTSSIPVGPLPVLGAAGPVSTQEA